MHGIFIEVEVDDPSARATPSWPASSRRSARWTSSRPTDTGRRDRRTRTSTSACSASLCLDAAPTGAVVVKKLYDGTELAR